MRLPCNGKRPASWLAQQSYKLTEGADTGLGSIPLAVSREVSDDR